MKILSAHAFEGPSLAAPVPAVRLSLALDARAAETAASLGQGFRDRLCEFLPDLEAVDAADEALVAQLRRGEALGLVELVARTALELQRAAGAAPRFWAAAPGGEPGIETVVIGHWDAHTDLAAAREAVATVGRLAAAARQGVAPADWRPEQSRRRFLVGTWPGAKDISTALLLREAMRREIPWHRLDPASPVVELGHGRFRKRFGRATTDETALLAQMLCRDKLAAGKLLADLGMPVAAKRLVGDREAAVRAAERIGYPVVVKPNDLGFGIAVSVGLAEAEAVRLAFDRAARRSRSVLVERFVPGEDHRILVVGGKAVAAARRLPPEIIGDGVRTVAALVAAANADPRRAMGPQRHIAPIALDAETDALLAAEGLGRDSVPAAGRVLRLRGNANVSTGGIALDVTDRMHPENARLAERAALALGLDIAGVDFIAGDIGRPWPEAGGAICEVNETPHLGLHEMGGAGGRSVAAPILDLLYPPAARCRVPIAAITGTSGKTTTAGMVARILEGAGRCVGLATSEGGFVGGERLVQGDLAGASGARLVLHDPEVEAAVIETARGGILKRGLGFDWCDVGAVLNLAEDHLGQDGVESLEALARVKRLVVERARGMAVLNADDPLCRAMAAHSPAGRICYVGMHPEEATVAAHRAGGGTAVTLDCTDPALPILLHEAGRSAEILQARDIPATLGGAALFNAANAAFAAAIAHGLGVASETIRTALLGFGRSWRDHPGRLMRYEGLPFDLLIDYAHNLPKLAAITATAERLAPGRPRILAFSMQGSRTDAAIRAVGRAAGPRYDRLIFFRRDAAPEGARVPALLREGALEGGADPDRVRTIAEEGEAIAAALALARPGDLVLLCNGTDYERTWASVAELAAPARPAGAA